MCKLFLDKEKLSSEKFARVDGQQGKCGKDIIDLVPSLWQDDKQKST